MGIAQNRYRFSGVATVSSLIGFFSTSEFVRPLSANVSFDDYLLKKAQRCTMSCTKSVKENRSIFN